MEPSGTVLQSHDEVLEMLAQEKILVKEENGDGELTDKKEYDAQPTKIRGRKKIRVLLFIRCTMSPS